MDNLPVFSDGPVLVIGAANVDIVGRLKTELHSGTSSPGRIRTSFGGVARNVAENLARLGQPVNLITAVGDDDAGQRLLDQTRAAGVNVDSVCCTGQHPTGSYLAVINSAGALQYAVDDMRVMAVLTPDAMRERAEMFKEASLLFIDANLPKDTLRTILSLARRARLKVCADPVSTLLGSRLQPYLSRLYLITPNSAEAAMFCEPIPKSSTRRQAMTAAKSLVSQGVEIAIVTLAELGLCYATSETSGYIPAIRTEILDPTGAGDALTAAVIFALLNDIPLDDAVRLGISAASLTLRYRGTVSSELSLEKLYDQLVI